PESTLSSAILKLGRLKESEPDRWAGGIRYNRPFLDGELGLAYVYSPSLTPYYEINPLVIAALAGGADPVTAVAAAPDDTIRSHFHLSSLFAMDAAQEWGDGTYRFEVGYLDQAPYTLKSTYQMKTDSAFLWNVSSEHYPRMGQDTLNIILSG